MNLNSVIFLLMPKSLPIYPERNSLLEYNNNFLVILSK